MKVYLSYVSSLLLVGNLSCVKRSLPNPMDSQVSSLSVGSLDLAEGRTAWSSFTIIMERISPDPQVFEEKFTAEGAVSGQADVRTLKVDYGTYNIHLKYFDKEGHLLYSECASEKEKVHTINKPTYNADIEICAASSAANAGEVSIGGTSAVSFHPKEQNGAATDSIARIYDTTFYPYRGEAESRPTCGESSAHDGLYFAVTEKSSLWSGSCDNDSWGKCESTDCLSKWNDIPSDAKRDTNGFKQVREPSCSVPCGTRYRLRSVDRKFESFAYVYDACPSQHWNNRYKEVKEGKNPCVESSFHVDLRKPLYLKLNGSVEGANIQVLIDTAP